MHELTTREQVDAALQQSHKRPQLLFKHSTRCSISSVAWSRVESALSDLEAHMDIQFLDLVAHREVSNYIAELLQEPHESPQAILLNKGEVVLEQSHLGIRPDELLDEVVAATEQ